MSSRHLAALGLFPLLVAAVLCTDAPGATVLHLSMDDGAGLVATDSSGNSLHGTLTGMDGTEWTSGISGSALDFDGSNDTVLVSDTPLLAPGAGDFSVSLWVLKRGGGGDFDDNYGVAMWGSGGGATGQNDWTLQVGSGVSSDRPSFNVEVGTTGYSARSPDNISLFEWHHVVGVRQGTRLLLYVDGVLVAEDTSLPTGAVVNDTAGRQLSIGANTQPTNARFFTNAVFDQVMVFDMALTDGGVSVGQTAGGEVAFLFNNPGGVVPEPEAASLLGLMVLLILIRRR